MPSTGEITLDQLRVSDEMLARIEARKAVEARKPRRERQTKPFVMVPIEDVIEVGSASKNFVLLLWLFLRYKARVQGTNTVAVSNKAVEAWGIDRHAKTRALRWLERQGHVSVRRRGKSSPLATLVRSGATVV